MRERTAGFMRPTTAVHGRLAADQGPTAKGLQWRDRSVDRGRRALAVEHELVNPPLRMDRPELAYAMAAERLAHAIPAKALLVVPDRRGLVRISRSGDLGPSGQQLQPTVESLVQRGPTVG